MSTAAPAELSVTHDKDRQRFTATLDGEGEVGHLDYDADAITMTILSTVVSPAFAGRGFAARLARAALDYAIEQGQQVVPRCSYIDTFVDRNPQYAELIVD
ncbi:hypothetical protein GCM10010401_09120 [Rarobacter faecitabidus]|nr:GNAT family N-acetyltransferase [Rarobacter faecitabidus]